MNDYLYDFLINYPHKLGWLLGYKDLSNIHSEWIKHLFDKPFHCALQAHRDSYKTTTLVVGIVRQFLLYPNTNILLLRKTDNDALDILRIVAKLILSENGIKLFHLFYNFQDIKTSLWNNHKLELSIKTKVSADPNLSAIGIGSAITGKHPDLIIADDIITLEDRISKAEREYVKLYIQELLNVVRDSCKIIFTGTPWHKDDAWNTIKVITKQIKRYSIYDIKPSIISNNKLNQVKQTLSPSMFACNYELNPEIEDKEKLFSNIRIVSFSDFDYEKIVCNIDKSYGGKDLTAMAIVGKIRSQNKFVAVLHAWNQSINELSNQIVSICKNHRVSRITTERNDDKGNFKKLIDFPVNDYQETQNKQIKIDSYLTANWSNIFVCGSSNKLAIEQISDYTYDSKSDDVADCLSNCMRELIGKSFDSTKFYIKNS
jgi:hypothetical protein